MACVCSVGLSLRKCVLSVLLTLAIVELALSFNMDIRSPVIHRGDSGTSFGFSVDMHRAAGNDWLLVGAPEDESEVPLSGAFYACPVTPYHDPGSCIRRSTEAAPSAGENITNQWLGATVRSAGEDGNIMACAPFYKSLAFDQVHPIGKCIIYDPDGNEEMVKPCNPTALAENSFNNGSHCLAGLSAEINMDQYVIGEPSRYAGQGSVTTDEAITSEEDETGSQDGELKGYSVGFGDFSDSEELDIVTGVPRGDLLIGVVYINNSSLGLIKKFEGFQYGAYFGGSVAASDLNGDGLDDLIVGAPNYWNIEAQKPDVGQVNIFYQTSLGVFDAIPTDLTGEVAGGRFGYVVTALGDITDDGVNDLAVAAPYDGSGAIYIFNGRMGEPINEEPSQVIRPLDFKRNISMEPFGFALAGNRDADENQYPDLLVGAYESDVAILIRTKPVIRLDVTLTFDSPGVNLTRRTLLIDGQRFSPFSGRTCVSYGGLGTKDSYDFNIQLTLDTKKLASRALFRDNNARTLIHESVTIANNAGGCRNFEAYLANQVIDKISPIVAQVSVEVIQEVDSLPLGEIPHVLDLYSKNAQNQIPIFVDCLNEGCNPNLVLSVKSDKSVLYFGDRTQVVLTIEVANDADEAFGARLFVFLPEEARYQSYRQIEADFMIVCERQINPQGATCDIGNPLLKKSKVIFELTIAIDQVPGDRTRLQFDLITNSISEELPGTLRDNDETVMFSLEADVNVMLQGEVNTDNVVFNDTAAALSQMGYKRASEVGDKIIHTYGVRNVGPAVIGNATLQVSWPLRIAGTSDKYLLYLVSASLSNGEQCDIQGGANPENLQLEGGGTSKRRRRSSSNGTSEARSASDEDGVTLADCSSQYEGCISITCSLRDMLADDSRTVLVIESRLWIDNLVQVDDPTNWEITSSALLTVNSIPYITQTSKLQQESATLRLTVIPLTSIRAQGVPIWAIIVPVVLGIILLVIIILVLFKCGFFRRKKLDLETLQARGQPSENDVLEVLE